mmetsp:Transcript_21701/g.51270  ORF Transcript_21701/g.51270 Transcript_21701/m.51270 type:complete len:216 (-) Transcript_21701:1048-1695(-)
MSAGVVNGHVVRRVVCAAHQGQHPSLLVRQDTLANAFDAHRARYSGMVGIVKNTVQVFVGNDKDVVIRVLIEEVRYKVYKTFDFCRILAVNNNSILFDTSILEEPIKQLSLDLGVVDGDTVRIFGKFKSLLWRIVSGIVSIALLRRISRETHDEFRLCGQEAHGTCPAHHAGALLNNPSPVGFLLPLYDGALLDKHVLQCASLGKDQAFGDGSHL